MKRLGAYLVIVFLVFGCGGGGAPAPTLPRVPGASGAAGTPQTQAPGPTFDLGALLGSPPAGATAAPTTERIQIVNLYVPGDEAPYGFDIYILHASPFGNFAAADPLPTDAPVAHADFGASSAPFDPGSLDGSEAWAAYRAGKPATHDNLVWNFAQNVVDGGRSTVVISSANLDYGPENKHHQVQVSYRNDKDPGGGATLAPTTGTLILDNSGLDAVWGTTVQKAMYVKVGDKCGDYYPSSPGQPQPALPGGPTTYLNLPTGTVPVIAYAPDQTATPACAGTPQTDPISANIPVGGFGYVFAYSTVGTDLKGFFVAPLQ